ncbi:MAG: YcgN family cysteine cluster protein [Gammaproteobacteria bacterium]|nr:YcgN family cysteine cluster protein [Gammaproteobacteria bacterium]
MPFWKEKTLQEMSKEEWESLCDGCAKCCLKKLEDEDSGDVFYTAVHCHLLDTKTCTCPVYSTRGKYVPECLELSPKLLTELNWLPDTCAYRLIEEGKDLPSWHPLVTGNTNSTFEAGMSIKDKSLSEEFIHPDSLEEHIIEWVKC